MSMRIVAAVLAFLMAGAAAAQDYEREQRWADQILPALMVGDAVWLQQKEGHKFLGLYTEAKNARAIAHHGYGVRLVRMVVRQLLVVGYGPARRRYTGRVPDPEVSEITYHTLGYNLYLALVERMKLHRVLRRLLRLGKQLFLSKHG